MQKMRVSLIGIQAGAVIKIAKYIMLKMGDSDRWRFLLYVVVGGCSSSFLFIPERVGANVAAPAVAVSSGLTVVEPTAVLAPVPTTCPLLLLLLLLLPAATTATFSSGGQV